MTKFPEFPHSLVIVVDWNLTLIPHLALIVICIMWNRFLLHLVHITHCLNHVRLLLSDWIANIRWVLPYIIQTFGNTELFGVILERKLGRRHKLNCFKQFLLLLFITSAKSHFLPNILSLQLFFQLLFRAFRLLIVAGSIHAQREPGRDLNFTHWFPLWGKRTSSLLWLRPITVLSLLSHTISLK